MSKSINSLACYAFDTLVARFEKRPVHALASFQEALSEPIGKPGTYPLFVTWNKTKNGNTGLRGCIGTFDSMELDTNVKQYSLIAALDDHRFKPISASELESLECGVTILKDFEPVNDPFDWQVGTHGVKASFGGSSSATFLPSVAVEQGWDKLTTLLQLALKAGVSAQSFEDIEDEIKLVRYKGESSNITYKEYREIEKTIHPIDEDEEE